MRSRKEGLEGEIINSFDPGDRQVAQAGAGGTDPEDTLARDLRQL